jgi:hypothetical protein
MHNPGSFLSPTVLLMAIHRSQIISISYVYLIHRLALTVSVDERIIRRCSISATIQQEPQCRWVIWRVTSLPIGPRLWCRNRHCGSDMAELVDEINGADGERCPVIDQRSDNISVISSGP